MYAKRGALVASLMCAAMLGAGCNQPTNDTMAQRSTSATSPPVIAPAPATNAGARAVTAVEDTTLTAKVKTALVAEPGLKSMPIDVTTKDSVVTLSGSVESSADRAKALQVAGNVEGVKSVVDNLSAKS